MLKWIKNNKAVLAASILNIAIFVPAVVLSACNPGAFIPTAIPADIAAVVGVPEFSSLENAEATRTKWIAWVEANNTLFMNKLEGPRFIKGLIIQTRDSYVDSFVREDGTFNPSGLLPFLGIGTLGLALRRPGDKAKEDARVAKEKEDSYNAGLKKGLAGGTP